MRPDFYIIYLAIRKKDGRKVLFYFSIYEPLTVSHLFQRSSNKAMFFKKILLISSQKIPPPVLSSIHLKKNGPQVLF
jgi:hypothetical protein